jgi:hypothetical protein
MDLSKLSDNDLQAVADGRMQDVSDAGLRIISGQQTPLQRAGTAVDTALGLQPSSPTALLESAKRPAMQVSTSDMDIGRQIGLTGRAAITGALGLPTLASDALVSLINMIGGKNIQMPSQAQQALMTQAGIPEPKTAQERTAQDIASAMGGVIGGYGLGAALPASMQASRELLMQSPIFQATSGGAAALASGLAREEGAGPLEQLGYGVLAGTVAPSAGAGAVTAAQAAGRGAREVVRPFTEAGREVIVGNVLRKLAREPEMSAARMEGYQPGVPGYAPTTAQASRDIGLAGAVPMVRGLDETGRFPAQQIQANQARMAVLDRLAKDEQALAAAFAKRKEVTDPLREAAFDRYTGTPEDFASRVQSVRDQIVSVLQSPEGKRLPVKEAMTFALRQLDDDVTDPRTLYAIKQNIQDAAFGKYDKEKGVMKLAKGELQGIAKAIDDQIEPVAPGYKDYLRKYSAATKGIQSMEEAQAFRTTVQGTAPIVLDESTQYMISQPSFVRALRNIGDDTKLSKTQIALLQRVGRDLDEGAITRLTAEPGSNTFKNISIANFIGQSMGKQMFGEVPGVMQKGALAFNWLYAGPDDAIRAVLVDAMLDPKLAARMMRRATNAELIPISQELQRRALRLGYGQVFGLTPE